MMADDKPVLVLGAGINGAAIARELALNGLPVVVVDRADVASGTTAFSSRLIHGGLRYLEYGEFDLVRESLAERGRWLKLAPHLVRPLELFIPVARRFSGWGQALRRLSGCCPAPDPPEPRGLWLVRAGLALYDLIAQDPHLPKYRLWKADSPGVPPVDRTRYRWLCSYWDAQAPFPERMVVELLEDGRRAAQEQGSLWQVLPYHEAALNGKQAVVRSAEGDRELVFQPAAVVNATGAWVDTTLKRFRVKADRLIGGTKGSHLVTSHSGLREALGGRGVYAEAVDGRPFFILPLDRQTLIGTTDIPYSGPPEQAVASQEEVEYLLQSARRVFPHVELEHDHIDWHYSGVRPLPFTGAGQPASITRRHFLTPHPESSLPMWSVIGGKITTCRSLAQHAAETILPALGRKVRCNSQQRPLPGAIGHPRDESALRRRQAALARATARPLEQVQAAWRLCGQTAEEILGTPAAEASEPPPGVLAGTDLPLPLVRYVIRHEWVTHLADLVERRLMLLFHPGFSRRCLQHLAELMVQEGKLPPDRIDQQIEFVVTRCRTHFGKTIPT